MDQRNHVNHVNYPGQQSPDPNEQLPNYDPNAFNSFYPTADNQFLGQDWNLGHGSNLYPSPSQDWHQIPVPQINTPVQSYGQPQTNAFGGSADLNQFGFAPQSHQTYSPSPYAASGAFGARPSAPEPLEPLARLTSRTQTPPNTFTQSQRTISPDALQNPFPTVGRNARLSTERLASNTPPIGVKSDDSNRTAQTGPPPPPATFDAIPLPAGTQRGPFLELDRKEITELTNSEIFGNTLFSIGKNSVKIGTTKTSLPPYRVRTSRKDIKRARATGKDELIVSSKGERPSKKAKVSVPKSGAAGRGLARKPSKDQGKEMLSESETDESSYYSSESEEEEPDEQSPLPNTRPQNIEGGVKYDMIAAVWLPRNRDGTVEEIRNGISKCWEVLKPLRDSWKKDSASLKEAEEAKKSDVVQQLQSRMKNHRDLLKAAIETSLENGHKDILARLGEYPLYSLLLQNLLTDRFKADDVNGALAAKVLEALSKCTTLDQEALEKYKIDKIIGRFNKKGNSIVKGFVKLILDNAATETKRKSGQAKSTALKPAEGKPAVGSPKPSPSGKINAAGKRLRDGDSIQEPVQKKLTPQGSTLPSNKIVSSVNKKLTTSSDGKSNTAAGTSAVKPKTTHVASKPSGFFSSLQSASKKPGTSNAAVTAAAQAKGQGQGNISEKKTPAVSAPPKPAFSFAETMANLTKPKEPEKSKAREMKPPETEEEKRNRLRKEGRRHLRVSFKPDNELVQTRYFTHDPEEELGHDSTSVRDDKRGEGQALKLHQGVDAIDEEEDISLASEITLRSYPEPILVDFEGIDKEERDKNFVTKGGLCPVDSPETKLQEQREANTLLVHYSDVADIPPSPREPGSLYPGETGQQVSFGPPQEPTVSRLARRFPGGQYMTSLPQTPIIPGGPDIHSILSALQGVQQQQQQQQLRTPAPETVPAAAPVPNLAANLERVFAMYSGNGAQTALQPQMPPPQHQQAPPPESAPAFDLQALLANVNQQQHQPPAQFQPSQPNTQLQAILAQLGQNATPQMQGYNFLNQAQGESQDENDRFGFDGNRDSRRNKGAKDKKKVKKYPYVCKFWEQNNCKKGDDCQFLHEQQ